MVNTTIFDGATNYLDVVIAINVATDNVPAGMIVIGFWVLSFLVMLANRETSKQVLIGASFVSLIVTGILIGTGLMTDGKLMTFAIGLSMIGLIMQAFLGNR